jgi:hypothetical protein
MLLKGANLSTRAGVVRYLRAIGLDPRGVVIQRSARNYAGPNCPGAGWACASTAHPVVQIAAAGGKNTYLCTSGRCAVVQTTKTTRSLAAATATNKATCIKNTGLSQSCTISQNSTSANTSNEAVVYENEDKGSGLTQTAAATAQITQRATGSTSTNKACVFQNIKVEGSTVAKKGVPVTVALEAHQSISITQDSATGGNALASATSTGGCTGDQLMQTQTLLSKAAGSGSITQNENMASSGPNVSLVIAQNQSPGFINVASGANTAKFKQENTLTAVASTPAGPVNQTQSSTVGGIQAIVNQFSTSPSTIEATQNERQCEDALASGTLDCSTTADSPPYTPTQVQYGPVKNKGGKSPAAAARSLAKVGKDPGSIQSGNDGDTFTINQTSNQYNDTGLNQTNVVQGACATSGNCTVTQSTNGTSNTQSGSTVNTQTTCSGNTCTPSSGTTGSVSVSPTTITASNVDVGEFGVGGMRGGDGTGSISVSGITAPVIGAFLYWHGPTNSSDPASNASVIFGGTPITGTNIGTASDNNWSFTNSQAYRADVTSLVTGNAAYSLSNFVKAGPPAVDINGVSLIVFYNDANSANDRNVVLWNGNDSNIAFGSDPADWSETISGVQYQGGTASLDLVVSDGQSFNDGAVVLNGNTGDPVAAGPSIFQGDSGPNYSGNPSGVTGSLWDVKSFDITRFLVSGSNTLNLTSGTVGDALSLVVAIANVPASAPVIG